MKLASDKTPYWARKLKTVAWAINLVHRRNLLLVSDSRYILESSIIPYFMTHSDVKKILFVGCAWFTKYYEKEYFNAKEYWTIDKDVKRAKYGATKHIIDSLSNLQSYFPPNYFDLIVCTGVLGWGLNKKEEVEQAFNQYFQCLRPEGLLILGWNDTPHRKYFPLELCQSLASFKAYMFPPLSASQYLTASRSRLTFNFYVKPSEKITES